MTSNESLVASLADNEISDFWRLCDELTVHQAAYLVVGIDPQINTAALSRDLRNNKRPAGYGAAIHALASKLRDGTIKGKHVLKTQTDFDGNFDGYIDGSTDLDCSIVDTDSVRSWLKSKGYKTGFFIPDCDGEPDYMNPNDARYAPKLAAAVSAWQAVTNAGKMSPKKALEKWLREHAGHFGLTDDDGNPVTKAMEECSTVANWQTSGGAPTSPGA